VQFLLQLSRWIDALSERVNRGSVWLILVMTLVSAANAVVRKVFNLSSNAFLEVQWYLFSGAFLLCAAQALKTNAHVRIDVIYGRFSRRTQVWIDIFGTLFFLVPVVALVLWLSWPAFTSRLMSGETSGNAGGLVQWPARLALPLGMALLLLQGGSEVIKRLAFLQGLAPDPVAENVGPSEEEALAEAIRQSRGTDGQESR
jgi:TRAP-type mannitol/chloroaromatic compound transport system permease small subunit